MKFTIISIIFLIAIIGLSGCSTQNTDSSISGDDVRFLRQQAIEQGQEIELLSQQVSAQKEGIYLLEDNLEELNRRFIISHTVNRQATGALVKCMEINDNNVLAQQRCLTEDYDAAYYEYYGQYFDSVNLDLSETPEIPYKIVNKPNN